MKSRRDPWCWPLSFTAAVILLLLLAAGAARYYPAGVLTPRDDEGPARRMMFVMPMVDVIPEEVVEAVPDPDEEEPPPPEPDVFRSLWDGWIAGRALVILDGPETADDVVVIEIPLPSWEELFRAPADTTAVGVLARSGLMWERRWQELRPWAETGRAMLKAGRYQAMKKSIFNEDWLESQPLK